MEPEVFGKELRKFDLHAVAAAGHEVGIGHAQRKKRAKKDCDNGSGAFMSPLLGTKVIINCFIQIRNRN